MPQFRWIYLIILVVFLGACDQPSKNAKEDTTTAPIDTPTLLATKEITSTPATSSPEDQPELPAPPKQPTQGPGGSHYLHAGITMTQVPIEGALNVFLFEPEEPRPAAAPVVLFSQGAAAVGYQDWIDHLVKRGNIVIFQTQSGRNASDQRLENTIIGYRAALEELQKSNHVRPEVEKVTFVGHSIGAVMSVELASAIVDDLPSPKALMLIQPPSSIQATLDKLSAIRPETLMLVIVSEDDTTVGDAGALKIWAATSQIPPENKDFIRIFSDDHGTPPLIADHTLTQTNIGRGTVDALDYYGTWKLLDALQSCSLTQIDCQYAFGNTDEERFMGLWSDGVPVHPMESTKEP